MGFGGGARRCRRCIGSIEKRMMVQHRLSEASKRLIGSGTVAAIAVVR